VHAGSVRPPTATPRPSAYRRVLSKARTKRPLTETSPIHARIGQSVSLRSLLDAAHLRKGLDVTTTHGSGSFERPLWHAWIRRTLMTAGIIVTSWFFLGGSPAEAATAKPNSFAETARAAAGAIGSGSPSGARITEQAVAPDPVGARKHGPPQQQPQVLDGGSTSRAGADRSQEVIDDIVPAVHSLVEPAKPTTQVARPDFAPTPSAVVGMAQPVLEPLEGVTTAIPGEPGLPSGTDREIPGSGVEAPHTSGALSMGAEFLAPTADSARPSSRSSSAPLSGGLSSTGSGSGANAGSILPTPVPPVPGPSQNAPDGTAISASGHGSPDRAQTVSGDASPLVFWPRLLMSLPATSRPTGNRERATRPSVSPD
jgi:hypothetical protein